MEEIYRHFHICLHGIVLSYVLKFRVFFYSILSRESRVRNPVGDGKLPDSRNKLNLSNNLLLTKEH
jgi:hypothetical protein